VIIFKVPTFKEVSFTDYPVCTYMCVVTWIRNVTRLNVNRMVKDLRHEV